MKKREQKGIYEKEDYKKIIENLDMKKISVFLNKIVLKDDKIKNDFLSYFDIKPKEKSFLEYENEIDLILKKCFKLKDFQWHSSKIISHVKFNKIYGNDKFKFLTILEKNKNYIELVKISSILLNTYLKISYLNYEDENTDYWDLTIDKILNKLKKLKDLLESNFSKIEDFTFFDFRSFSKNLITSLLYIRELEKLTEGFETKKDDLKFIEIENLEFREGRDIYYYGFFNLNFLKNLFVKKEFKEIFLEECLNISIGKNLKINENIIEYIKK